MDLWIDDGARKIDKERQRKKDRRKERNNKEGRIRKAKYIIGMKKKGTQEREKERKKERKNERKSG